VRLGADIRRPMTTLILALPVLLVLVAADAPRANRCARARAVTSPEDIAISPDGRHVYVASFGSHAVAAAQAAALVR
jgi:hypothetical protein